MAIRRLTQRMFGNPQQTHPCTNQSHLIQLRNSRRLRSYLLKPVLITIVGRNIHPGDPLSHLPIRHIRRNHTTTNVKKLLFPIMNALYRHRTHLSNSHPSLERVEPTGIRNTVDSVEHLKRRLNTVRPADKLEMSNPREPNRIYLRNVKPITPQNISSELRNRQPKIAFPEISSIQRDKTPRGVQCCGSRGRITSPPLRTKIMSPHKHLEFILLPVNHSLVRTRRRSTPIFPFLLSRILISHDKNQEEDDLKR
ncbi:hypothetical protein HanHA89_Chr02g0049961 [Helianthus annuus]|nr:hypothetical protein HanHA89_Chr02g0049961 [Helianthus annuus]